MKKRRPAIAVIIPCYNDSSYVAEAIQSVRQQSFEDWECAVVDDGSTDDSLRFIEAALSEDDRFAVAKHRENRGLSAARNTGLAHTSAPFVAFLDADDLMLRRSLEDRMSALLAGDSDEVAGVYAGVRYEVIDVGLVDMPSAYRSGPNEVIDFVMADGECPFPVHAPLTTRSVIEEVGGFDESMMSGAEDWDLWYRILRCGYMFIPATTTSLVYRFRPGGMTRGDSGAHVEAATRLIEAAHSPATPDCSSARTTSPLHLSLGDYRRQITIADRGIRFAAIAALEGRREEANQILQGLPVSDWALIIRHVDIMKLVERALRRVGADHARASREEAIDLINTSIHGIKSNT